MPLNIKKSFITLTLLSSFFTANVFADIQILSGENEISQSVSEHFQQSAQLYDGSFAKGDALYINVGTASENQIAIAKSHVVKGDIVIIDLSTIASDEEKIEQSQHITGLGISAPVIVTGVYQGDNLVNAVVSDVVDENGNPLNNPEAELESINQSLVHSLTRLGFGGK
ncbi:cytolysin secretion protein [Vibrio hyugaensis]|uniref:Cytolysin secretion protein n=1 Tax=Vibrio hyugaensis TaxID=1534743 RepID=A0ABQ5XXF6_9VIBR|nr:cytolysin secretion protein [Vibrio hyugaensis]GLR02982.1 hypothetical protein GCM10007906_05690 [Vibrio hyugaensis]